MKYLLISLSLCSTLGFADGVFPECGPVTASGTECVTNISQIHPLQSNVGKYAIDMTIPKNGMLPKLQKKCQEGHKALIDNLIERGAGFGGTAAIIGPLGKIYLINGNHHAYALNQLESSSYAKQCDYTGQVYVYIVENLNSNTPRSFEKYLLKNKLVWLYDNSNKRITFSQMPDNISKMGDDPYRSVIKLVEDSECNKKHPIIDTNNTTPFMQFYWAQTLYNLSNGKYTDLNANNAGDYSVDAYNVIRKNYVLFASDPGTIQSVDQSYNCKKL